MVADAEQVNVTFVREQGKGLVRAGVAPGAARVLRATHTLRDETGEIQELALDGQGRRLEGAVAEGQRAA